MLLLGHAMQQRGNSVWLLKFEGNFFDGPFLNKSQNFGETSYSYVMLSCKVLKQICKFSFCSTL